MGSTDAEVYGYGTLAIIVISLLSLIGALVVPIIQKKAYQYSMLFFMAMAVGTLASDALLHLLPMALNLHTHGGTGHDSNSSSRNDNSSEVQEDHDDHDHMVPHTYEDGHNFDPSAHHTHEERTGTHDHNYIWKCCAVLGAIYVLYMFELVSHMLGRRSTHSHNHSGAHQKDGCRGSLSDQSPFRRQNRCYQSGSGSGSTVSTVVVSNEKRKLSKTESTIFCSICGQQISSNRNESSNVIATVENGVVGKEKFCTCTKSEFLLFPTVNSVAPVINNKSAPKAAWKSEEKTANQKPDKPERAVAKRENLLTCGLKPVAFMIMVGDAVHNFADGLAVGAAFTSSTAAGLSTTLAVFCHEVPHELGDFAVLIQSGLSVKTALLLNLASSITALAGLYLGIHVASNEDFRFWVFAAVAGVFLYVALVSMVHELKEFEDIPPVSSFFIQNAGILVGFTILLLIALYEDKIQTVL